MKRYSLPLPVELEETFLKVKILFLRIKKKKKNLTKKEKRKEKIIFKTNNYEYSVLVYNFILKLQEYLHNKLETITGLC